MPEVVTKYPETALKILKDANINCGSGTQQKILINCPKQNFCSLPTGELCIYGLQDIPQMTQIHLLDFFLLPNSVILFASVFVMVFLLGIVMGIKIK